MNQIIKAQRFAHAAHDSIGQKRKYTGAPYWVHTDEVAAIVASVTDDPESICVAHLHDVLEDVAHLNDSFSAVVILENFGQHIVNGVIDLTDIYDKESYPEMNRRERKSREAIRIGGIPDKFKTVKLADLISNTTDIVRNDPKFAKTYLAEKAELLPKLVGGNTSLHARATALLESALIQLAGHMTAVAEVA